MQSGRLFEIIYILLEKEKVTAMELAKHFEVSVRTIYRDVENLSAAGIPIYMNKGRGGGISLLPEFVLNKAVITDNEKQEILSSLKAMSEISPRQDNQTLQKLGSLFGRTETDWIEVDFGSWSDGIEEAELFQIIKNAILKKNVVEFIYVSTKGQELQRIVEPLKLIYRGGSWYLYAYCHKRQDMRFFKFKRIKSFKVTQEHFNRNLNKQVFDEKYYENKMKMVHLKLRVDKRAAYRIYDEFTCYEKQEDGKFIVEIDIPDNEWLIYYVLGFGRYCEVLEPKEIRSRIESELRAISNNYK